MHFIGIDPSFTGLAIVSIDENADILDQNLLSTDSKTEVEDRLLYLVETTMDHIQDQNLVYLPNMIYMEGIAFSRKSQYAHQLGALHFMLRVYMKVANLPYQIKTPQQLKKFVTGKGNCKKDLMLLKTFKRWGLEFEDDNLCDAYGLARMALYNYKSSDTKIGTRIKQ